MRQLFKPVVLLTAAINLFLLVLVVGRGDGGATIASELFPLSSRYTLNELFLTQRVGTLVEHQYVDPERVDPNTMFDRALEQVQRGVPELMFERNTSDNTVTVRYDDSSDTVAVGPMNGVDDVVEGLKAVLAQVGERWEGDVDELPEIEYDAINGMLSTLDPHSILLPPDNAKAMDVQIQGQFGGLGITISLRGDDATLTVISVLPETPAMRSGLKAGDKILQIDGESTVNVSLNEAVSKLRGPVGAKVEILVGRKTFDEPRIFKIRRDLIRIESIETEYLGDGYGLIKLKAFQHNSYQQLISGLSELKSHGPIKGLILDLRNNPGGPLQQAVDISDRFIDSGELVTTVQSTTREKDVKRAHRSGTEPPYPMVVILDSNSASASEIVAGALKNHDRAVIIGETSFGKGSVQNLFQNPDDSKLKLTMLQYLTPGDQSIQSVGITPDVRLAPVYFDDQLVYLYSTAHIFRERDLEEHLDGDPRDYVEQDPPQATLRYFAPEEFRLPAKEGDEVEVEAEEELEPPKPDPLDDYQVRFARDLLVEAGRATRQATLKQASGMIAERAAAAEKELIEQMASHGVDWTPGPEVKGDVGVEVTVADGAEVLQAGTEVDIVVKVTNKGGEPLHQVRAITRSGEPLFNQVEFVFGKLAPGESRSWTRKLKLYDGMKSLVEPVTFEVFQGEKAKLDKREVLVEVRAKPMPAFAYSVVPIDDGSGTSKGNGDGRIQRGETIDLMVVAANVGEGTTKRAFFKVTNMEGRHVYLKSGTANFGELAPGEHAARRLSFEVKESLPGDTLTLQMRGGDAHVGVQSLKELVLPVVGPEVVAPSREATLVKVKSGALARVSPDLSAVPVASYAAGAVIATDGKLGDWLRVSVPVGDDHMPGWISEDDVSRAKGAEPTGDSVVLKYSAAAPRIAVAPPAYDIPESLSTLTVTGAARDDGAVRKVYAFVNGKKRYFWSVSDDEQVKDGDGVNIPLDFKLPLESGTNLVEVYVHDDEEMVSGAYFQVYRDPTLQAAVAE